MNLLRTAFVTLALALLAPHHGEADEADPGGGPSTVIFPAQSLPLVFSHQRHLGRGGLDCEDCHDRAAGSRSSLDVLTPTEAACTGCHAIERDRPDKAVTVGAAPARCDACHLGYQAGQPVARVVIPPPNLKFDHRRHVVDRELPCQRCHGDLAAGKVDLATRAQLPRMATCLECHDGQRAPDRCITCHLADSGGRMQIDFAEGKLAPSGSIIGDDHDLAFEVDHGPAAQNDAGYCASCHQKSFCVDCHAGAAKPLDFHGNDYVALHALDARRNQPDCSTCHRLQTFCVGCHSRAGVALDQGGGEYVPPSAGPSDRRFHPTGWVELDPAPVRGARGEDHHSFQAQRNLEQCVSCHRESFCLGCHTAEAGSFRINPHPGDWVGSRRCEALLARAGRMCLRCHTNLDEVDCNSR